MSTHYIRQARATERDLKHVWRLFYLIQEVQDMGGWTDHKQERFTKLLVGRIEQMGEMPLARVLGGYETLVANCADLSQSTLEFNSEIKDAFKALESHQQGMLSVDWQSPDTIPTVKKGESLECWVAVESTPRTYSLENGSPVDKDPRVHTFIAQYVNKPVQVDDNGDTDTDDYLVTADGEPWPAVGWFSIKNHADFDDYYEALEFNDRYKLLGWANYTPPSFERN